MSAIDSIEGNAEAVDILRRELMPKYEGIVAKREKARAATYAYRATERGKAKRAEYGRKYYAENRERCNRASRECHRRRRAETSIKESEVK